ncbi:tRNA(fMet)-specific endonuclease VapC [Desulfonatronum thiosulfatophilum]|uniref:Ribonuclease VapC n=1 Tax=Desulfonatronum thiosulfatophilum TaxID=617002 RepID=A0A1G6E7U8_9BACT|nr:type II toxin-antitoxin system VapC family toxin [Desulfonatronum thiosulfatophilum]SDB53461.1 tRNA(fMet)-specific endonuclease VapC [Desulfonatronum thiosulfatophilum]
MKLKHRFLLDTNILSDLVRHPQGIVAQRIREHGEQAVFTSIIVACELRFGAAKRNAPRLSAQVEAILAAMDVLPLEPPADEQYARLRLHLEQNGSPIGPNDMLIAAQALAEDSILVSANTKEFRHVPGLVTVDWLESDPS